MLTLIAALALFHLLALAGVLVMARYSVVLVDDCGRPLHVTPWHEQRVPVEAPVPLPVREG